MRPFSSIKVNGFLPCVPPLARYDNPRYRAIDDLLRDLPQSLSAPDFRDRVCSLPDISQELMAESHWPTLHALFRDLTILTSCWCLRDVYMDKATTANCRVPK